MGSEPDVHNHCDKIEAHSLPEILGGLFEPSPFRGRVRGWICNVDLDYFFCRRVDEEDSNVIRLFSPQYVRCVFSSLRDVIASGRIVVFTMALSPECCGGWDKAEELAREVCRIMDIPFRLP
jgi:hypothetical protein